MNSPTASADLALELFVKPYEAPGYRPEMVKAKFAEVWFDADVYCVNEVNEAGQTIKSYEVAPGELTDEVRRLAHDRRGLSFGRSVRIWKGGQQQAR